MAILGIKVPEEIAEQLEPLEAPGERVPLEEKHITLLYLGDDLPCEVLGAIVVACARLTERVVPFELGVHEITTFPKNDHGWPVICPVIGQAIHSFHTKLMQACDNEHVEYSKKFPTYKPHVTLSYAPDDIEGVDIDPIIWTCGSMVLWGGDHGDQRLATTFEFMGR